MSIQLTLDLDETLLSDTSCQQQRETDNFDRFARYSSRLVWLTLFVDSLLLTLPIPFLPIELQDAGWSSFQIGVVFGAKAVVQFIANPFCGYVTNRIGSRPMMILGSIFVVVSTLVLAFCSIDALAILSLGRALQGLGSAMCFSSGMAHLADVFVTDEERGAHMGAAMGGIGFAVLVGPPLGGALHAIGGRMLAFGVVGVVCLAPIIFQVYMILNPHFVRPNQHIILPDLLTSFRPMMDPYVLLIFYAIMLCNGSVAMMEYLLPLRMSNKYHLSTLLIGMCFLPSTFAYFIATPILGRVGGGLGRSRLVQGGLVVVALAMIVVPVPNEIVAQLASFTLIGSGMAMLDGSVGTILANIMDVRHARKHGYGLVFACCDMGFSAGYLIGSYGGAAIAQSIGFEHACWCFAGAMILCAPIICFVARFDQGALVAAAAAGQIPTDDSLDINLISPRENLL